MSNTGDSGSIDELAVLKVYGRIRRQLNLELTHILKPMGIGTKQALLVRELRARKAASPSELAEVTFTDPTSTGKMIETLVRKGWMKRSDHPEDRRQWLVSLTGSGIRVSQKLETIYRNLGKELCATLSAREKQAFYKMLLAISSHLDSTSMNKRTVK